LASDSAAGGRSAQPPQARKTDLLRRMLALSQQEVLLVAMDGLAGLLEEKERLIEAIRLVDEELSARGEAEPEAAEREEQGRLLAIILENERAVEKRMDGERDQLKGELRALERETRLRRYLERPVARRVKVDLKQ